MKDLHDLVDIISGPKGGDLQSLGLMPKQNKASKVGEFFSLLTTHFFETDDEAAQYFYKKDKSYPAYQKLRKTIKDRLISALFLVNLQKPSYNYRQKAYYECYKEWAAAKILFGKNASYSAVQLSQKLLKIAKRFEFTELVVDITHTLRLFYGTIDRDYKKYKEYNRIFKEYEKIWIIENKAEEYYTYLSIEYINSKTDRGHLMETISAFKEELAIEMLKYDSYQLHLCGRLIEAEIYSFHKNQEKVIECCNKAINFFRDKIYKARVPLQIFYYKKMISCFQLRRYDECLEIVKMCEATLDTASFNWFKIKEIKVLIHLHTEALNDAFVEAMNINSNPRFETLPTNIKEFWMLIDAYFNLLEVTCQKKKTFKLLKFFNDIEVLSKDKTGINISLVIFKFLFLLREKKYGVIIDEMDAINQYRKRYLLKGNNNRSNLFIKMLLQVPKNCFDKDAVEAACNPLFEELNQLPLEISDLSYQLEIIPYEKLWGFVIEQLNDRSV